MFIVFYALKSKVYCLYCFDKNITCLGVNLKYIWNCGIEIGYLKILYFLVWYVLLFENGYLIIKKKVNVIKII